VSVTLVHAGKYNTEDKLKIQTIHKLNTTQKRQQRKIQQNNYPGFVTFYDTRPGNEMGLFYNAPEPTRGNLQHRSIMFNWNQKEKLWENIWVLSTG